MDPFAVVELALCQYSCIFVIVLSISVAVCGVTLVGLLIVW